MPSNRGLWTRRRPRCERAYSKDGGRPPRVSPNPLGRPAPSCPGGAILRLMRPVDALYENGLLRPVSPLPLRSGERVALIVVRRADLGHEFTVIVPDLRQLTRFVD